MSCCDECAQGNPCSGCSSGNCSPSSPCGNPSCTNCYASSPGGGVVSPSSPLANAGGGCGGGCGGDGSGQDSDTSLVTSATMSGVTRIGGCSPCQAAFLQRVRSHPALRGLAALGDRSSPNYPSQWPNASSSNSSPSSPPPCAACGSQCQGTCFNNTPALDANGNPAPIYFDQWGYRECPPCSPSTAAPAPSTPPSPTPTPAASSPSPSSAPSSNVQLSRRQVDQLVQRARQQLAVQQRGFARQPRRQMIAKKMLGSITNPSPVSVAGAVIVGALGFWGVSKLGGETGAVVGTAAGALVGLASF